MTWKLHFGAVILCLIANETLAEESGFYSPSDMNFKEPFFSLGADIRRSASVSLGDVNGDGTPDAVIANGRHWPQINQIFFNQNGRFRIATPIDNIAMTSYTAELADLDNDGDLDIVEINDMAPNRLFANDGLGHFTYQSDLDAPSHGRNVALADIDGNGLTDILIINRRQRDGRIS